MKYKIVNRSVSSRNFFVQLEDGRTIVDQLHWVHLNPMIGDTGTIIQINGKDRMMIDAFEAEFVIVNK
jgi:hypothetical protein